MSAAELKNIIHEREIEAKLNRIIVRKVVKICDYLYNGAIVLFVGAHFMWQFVDKVYARTNLFNFMWGKMDAYGKFTHRLVGISAVIISAQFVIRKGVKLLKVRPADIDLSESESDTINSYERVE